MWIASNLIGKSFTEFATENANYYNLDQSANISRMQSNYRLDLNLKEDPKSNLTDGPTSPQRHPDAA